MRSWSAPELPRLPGSGHRLRLYDTAAREVREVGPAGESPGEARMYVCGVTPYDATHLGHANTYVAFDMVNRVWRDAGHRVHYVQNATDVDDPLLERAEAIGADWRELAASEIDKYRGDMAALRVLPPRDYVAVTEVIDEIAETVVRLREKGVAYELDGDVYFSVAAAPKFGAVSGCTEAEMLELFGERGGDPGRPGKRNRLDWLLWRAERPGEPSWPSPLGRGRPGWHIECTTIALANLGPGFDLMGGGSDLVFPHHEMGASEGHIATGEWPFARSVVHSGMVALDGEKMSKSRGNLVFVSELRRELDPMAIRLALLANHYRADWEWTPALGRAAAERLARWRAAVARDRGPDARPVLAQVRERLADDLDTPGALAAVDAWAAAEGDDPDAPGLVRDLADALLGVAL
ncbi:L-cysteine:1D-myo-inositol 2-amino-2-deoxy-alpha-D-glucopyranoside ligase [Thermopolyspora flexuosa]|uniref:L-cysteine:1D-myo-inositol 2-amino-2-deoxy-alpha-D-glucopyranoside ligase n=1 Tax=Thermopolyspora flexuosa TaxID=103836 RepID=A0A543IXT0_9ACTN|nr:cysteine--1-D-myo-inosityl 2-amino-2-deoxy-alpha-D-glucopyranoside ligase [Thermopolyspora flexuosa]TQM75382.1 cysteinyl-tRNA synthetase [Thermopolyspora flexuosa]GGM58870.1 L-cysteine:1D-myo-inositol 2-amino-2-deoxy-alpha-D-glucopyranoside ligase [Thermopolyspora flexuosa]